MKHLTNAVKMSVQHGNWYSALTLALALPDICSKVDEPSEKSVKKRYTRWADQYFTPKYTHNIGPERREHVFLSSNDFYALRCAVIHEGSDSVMLQKAREALDRFQFIAPHPRGHIIHCNLLDTHLQLQVDKFCADVCEAVDEWHAGIKEGSDQALRVSELMIIREFSDGEGISF
ncbi:hypothetical protein [Glutamicibacter sp.]|uniref:hypothetical protein n=1 Tax=Glutamicibacter sp. TaxID=1931995 RepID=UPI003D6AD022